MTIIGVDPSVTSTGVAVCCDSKVDLWQIEPGKLKPPLTGLGRLAFITERVTSALVAMDPRGVDVLLVIEGVVIFKGPGLVNVALHWMIRRRLADEYSFTTLVVPPATLKKFVTKNGSSGKSEVGQAIQRRWGGNLDGELQEDVAEAFALMQVGRCWRDVGKYPQWQKDCLKKIVPEDDGASLGMACNAVHDAGGRSR